MESRYAAQVAALRTALFDAPARLSPALRKAAGSGRDLPTGWAGYVAKVREASYRITDGDVAALEAAGHTQEEIFEVTVASATGAALHRLDRALAALRREG